MSALLQLLGHFVVGWLVPLLAGVIILPFLQIVVFINPILGGFLCLLVGGFLSWRAVNQAHGARIPVWNSWQLWCWGIIFLPATILAFVTPAHFHLWALLWEGIVLLVLGVPGVVSVTVRHWFVLFLKGELVLTVLLYGGTLGRTNTSLIVLALLMIALATMFFVRAARPHELRRAQRQSSRWIIRFVVVILILAFTASWWPALRGGWFILTGHDLQVERIVIQEVGKSPTPVREVKVPGVGKYKPLLERIKGH